MNQQATPLTRQQLFDNALNGIRAQGHRQSVGSFTNGSSGSCVYISPSGDRCAVGHSLPASITRERLEQRYKNSGTGPDSLRVAFPEVAAVIHEDDLDFLARLQRVHDNRRLVNEGASYFEPAMEQFAAKHDLVYTPRKVIA